MRGPRSQATPPPAPSRILILGGGFAGVYCARRLEKLLPTARITLVNDENYFVFQPLLPEVVGASLEPAHVISPLRHLLRRTEVVKGSVTGIDLAAQSVEVTERESGERANFHADRLVLALGSIVDVSRTPGMTEHALLMKNLADALELRQTLIARLERAVLTSAPEERSALLTFVVVGGGFSGVETAAEMLDLVRDARRFYPQLAGEKPRVVVVEGRDRVLGELDARLGRFAQKQLEQRGMEFRLDTRTRAVSAEHVYFENGERIATRTVVCTIGNSPHPSVRSLGFACERGRVCTDEFLRVRGSESVWAIGDCAWSEDGYGQIAPPTAQFACRQGQAAAANIARSLAGEALVAFRYRSVGQLATLGHLNAVAQLGPLRFSGFFAWWLWRTIYLAKLPTIQRRLRVVIDWTFRLFFPRDLTVVDLQPTTGLAQVHLEAGETLFRQGDPSAAFYVVQSGCIELTQQDESGALCLREQLTSGAHFGEGSLLGSRVRRTTATATEPTTVLAYRAKDFDALVPRFPAFRRMLEGTASRFQIARELIPKAVPRAVLGASVRTLMARPPITLPSTATLRTGLEEMTRRPFGCWPLLDTQERLIGVITLTDLFYSLRKDVDLDQPLLEFATRKVVTVGPEDPVERAIELMRRYGIKHMPVADAERRVVGMLSFRDLVRVLLQAAPEARQGSGLAAETGRAP